MYYVLCNPGTYVPTKYTPALCVRARLSACGKCLRVSRWPRPAILNIGPTS